MLLPTTEAIQLHIEALRAMWDSITPDEELEQSMLADALKSELNGRINGKLQEQLLLLNIARQQIEQVITTLLIYKAVIGSYVS